MEHDVLEIGRNAVRVLNQRARHAVLGSLVLTNVLLRWEALFALVTVGAGPDAAKVGTL